MAEVYFADLRAWRRQDSLAAKVRRLVERAGISQVVAEKDLVAVKVHFGERGGDAYVSPVFVRQVVDAVKAQGGKPFVTDTNTLYSGSRANSVDHLTTAVEHGFDFAVLGCPVIIADGLKSDSVVDLPGVGKIFPRVHAAADLVASDALVVLSHFKGHEMAGFGGAVKNLAMGCAPAAGKRDQHALRATVHREKCVGCGECVAVCPVHAIALAEGRALIDRGVCIGCGECMTVCPQRAIDTSNPEDLRDFAERLAAMEKRLADIDSYFTPLYAFLGLVYDPANEAVLAAYPTLDKRISALDEKLVQLQRDLAALRESLEPRTKEPRPVR